MKKTVLFPLLLINLLVNGQNSKTVTIVKSGLCNVKGLDCIKQQKVSSSEWPSGWIEFDVESNTIKIYSSGVQKVELVASLKLFEIVEDRSTYRTWKGKQYYENSSWDIWFKFEFPANENGRTTFYLFDKSDGSLGHYYICRPRD